jgi:hypothetical protein
MQLWPLVSDYCTYLKVGENMALPKKIIVAGHTVKIQYLKDMSLGETEIWGLYDDDRHIISLRTGMEESRKMEVFLHECIHAIDHIHGLGLTEKAVNLLGIELLALIRNNKIDVMGGH